MKEMLGGCCVCADENGWTDNPLIYCDGPNCEVAVHQGCYGIQVVPEGEWLCAKCSASSSTTLPQVSAAAAAQGVPLNGGSPLKKRFRCELCPSTFGALKRTDTNGWSHVICALYIPEVRFGDVHSMEPVILADVPNDRYDKICYICENSGKNQDAKFGACMSCNKIGCKRGFHVTCAQQKGLLCEEGGIAKNVKYCGYCENHLRKAQNDPLIKVIPACPVTRGHPSTVVTPSSQTANSHMLVESGLVRTPIIAPSNSGGTSSIFGASTNFSPPLTTSSRSSVALDITPPLNNMTHLLNGNGNGTANGVEQSVGAHLQQIQQAQNAAAAAAQLAAISQSTSENLNGNSIYSNNSQHLNSYFSNELASRIPANFLPNGDFHLNGTNDLEEKTVKAVLTAPLAKAKRNRPDMLEKTSTKRARLNAAARAAAASASASSAANPSATSPQIVGKSASMQRLISLVAPVVSETVSDFQRDRIADRTAAERRAAAAMSAPSTSAAAAEIVATATNGISSATSSATPSASVTKSHPTLPSSMEQLLERQWEQGSQLLMSQAHFDVAQLLTCLHQLKTENVRLEEQFGQLTKRLGHLSALNSRLAQPLGPLGSPEVAQAQAQAPPAPPQLSRPIATHPPVATPQPNSLAAQRATPAAAATVPATNLVEFAANLSPERLAQLNASATAINSMYRNSIIDPAILTQLVMNQNYLQNQQSVQNSAAQQLSNSQLFSRILQQQGNGQFAALVNSSQSSASQNPPPSATPSAAK